MSKVWGGSDLDKCSVLPYTDVYIFIKSGKHRLQTGVIEVTSYNKEDIRVFVFTISAFFVSAEGFYVS